MPKIKFDHVTKIYNNQVIGIDDVSFSVEKGEFVFIIGNSGAGKSTLLKLLTAQMMPTVGEVSIEDQLVTKIKEKNIPLLRRKFGIMQQEMGLLEDRNIYSNIAFAMMATEQPRKLIAKRVEEVLGVVGLRRKMEQFPHELSGGEVTRALLARALVSNPRILVADEPTANLDPDASWDLMCLLDDINRQGITVIVASHAKELVTIMKKRVITLMDGRIIIDEKKGRYNTRLLDTQEKRKKKEEAEL